MTLRWCYFQPEKRRVEMGVFNGEVDQYCHLHLGLSKQMEKGETTGQRK